MPRTLPVVLLLLLARSAIAWNVTGHEVVASIAFDVLKAEHPKTLAKALTWLKAHPLPELEARQVLAMNAPADQRDKAVFLAAARFPDDVRMKAGIKGYSHPTWHYIDFPLSLAGDSTKGPDPETPNALTALAGQATVLKGNNPDADKAVALCWVLHLVGDLHQPLHAVSLFSRQQPKGDRGGNDTFVRFGGGRTINLHSVWDEMLGQDAKFAAVTRIATELEGRPDLARAKLADVGDLDPEHWARASFDLARQYAYLNATLHGGEEKAGVELPGDYGKNAKAVAERQVVLAGYRLVSVLVKVLGE